MLIIQKQYKKGVVLILLLAGIFSSCERPNIDTTTTNMPTIAVTNFSLLFSQGNLGAKNMAYLGEGSIVIKAKSIRSSIEIKAMSIKIYATHTPYTFEKEVPQHLYLGKKEITPFDMNMRLPEDITSGDYTFELSVRNHQEEVVKTAIKVSVMERSNPATNIAGIEVEGVKLIVSYQNVKTIDVREPYSNKNDILNVAKEGGKILSNNRFYISNAMIYGEGFVCFLFTGLDLHVDHFHTSEPEITISSDAQNPSIVDWMSSNVAWTDDNGNLNFINPEGIMNKYPIGKIPHVTQLKKSKALYPGHLFITDNDESDKNLFKINVIKTTYEPTGIVPTILASYGGFTAISSASSWGYRLDDEYGIFATNKAIDVITVSPQDQVQHTKIAYPVSFSQKPMDELIYRLVGADKDIDKTSVLYGIKKDQGIFLIDPKNNKSSGFPSKYKPNMF